MRKLRLDIDALQVDSFDAEPRRIVTKGTVDALEATLPADATCTSCQTTTRIGNCFCTECASCFDCTVE